MSATVSGLLDLARAHARTSHADECDLGDVLESIRQSLTSPSTPSTTSPTAATVSVEIRRPIRVAAPAELVRRAVTPVVDNTVRQASTVRLTAWLEGRLARVEVSDDGPGVSQQLASRLFEAGRTGGNGTGLGLALARRVARSVGGDVQLTTTTTSTASPTGAAFLVTLPIA